MDFKEVSDEILARQVVLARAPGVRAGMGAVPRSVGPQDACGGAGARKLLGAHALGLEGSPRLPDAPLEKGGRLWLTHVISALTNTAGHPGLIVEYAGLLTARDREVHRLARFIGRAEGAEVHGAVELSLRGDLQHHRISLADTLTERWLPFSARALYAQLHLAVSPGEVDAKDEILALLARIAAEEQAAGFELQHRDLLAGHQRLARDLEQLRSDAKGLSREDVRLRDRLRALAEAARDK
jgi:hypothetical protein